MRTLTRSLAVFGVFGLASCGGTEQGAILTVAAPDGPLSATRIEIVLASADAQLISTIDNQRITPARLEEATVVYYRQRATGGIVESVGQLDSFVVRVERDATTAPDEAFIPFVLAYDDDTLVGVGSVNDADGEPGPITIEDGVLVKYAVTMQALTAASASAAIARGELMAVACLDGANRPWTSGIAWRGASGLQRRLLLPALGETDATGREPDLDCDDHAAWTDDCDDLREAFHDGSRETCDGVDSNCDGARYEVLDCALGTTACGTTPGVRICDELNPAATASCAPDPSCACASGAVNGCNRCVLDFHATSDPAKQTPCAPAVGFVLLPQCTDGNACTVEVVAATGGWEAFLAAGEDGPFLTKVIGIHGKVALRAKRGGDVAATENQSVGTVQLVVTAGTAVTAIGIDLQLGAATDACTPVMNGSGNLVMTCLP